MRELHVTAIDVQQKWGDVKVYLAKDTGQMEGHIHPIVKAVEIDGHSQLIMLIVKNMLKDIKSLVVDLSN